MGLASSKLLSQQFRLALASTHAGDRQKGGQEYLQEAPAAVLGIASCFMPAEASHTPCRMARGLRFQPGLLSILSSLPLGDQTLASTLKFCFEGVPVLTIIRSSLQVMTAETYI